MSLKAFESQKRFQSFLFADLHSESVHKLYHRHVIPISLLKAQMESKLLKTIISKLYTYLWKNKCSWSLQLRVKKWNIVQKSNKFCEETSRVSSRNQGSDTPLVHFQSIRIEIEDRSEEKRDECFLVRH